MQSIQPLSVEFQDDERGDVCKIEEHLRQTERARSAFDLVKEAYCLVIANSEFYNSIRLDKERLERRATMSVHVAFHESIFTFLVYLPILNVSYKLEMANGVHDLIRCNVSGFKTCS